MSSEEYIDRVKNLLESRGYRLVGDYGKDELSPETSDVETYEHYGVCLARVSKRLTLYDISMGDAAFILIWRSYGKYEPLGSGTFVGVSSVTLISEESSVASRELSKKRETFTNPFEVNDYTGAVLGTETGVITLSPPMIVYSKGSSTSAYLDVVVESYVSGDFSTLYKCEAGFEIERVLVFSRQPFIQVFEILALLITVIGLASILRSFFE